MTPKTHHAPTAAALVLLGAAVLGLTACQPVHGSSQSSGAPAVTISGSASPGSGGSARTGTVPHLVGLGLQAAQDAAQAVGFHNLTSHDSAGRDRHQILDRDWKVCSQTPAAGSRASTGTKVDLGAVKTGESCPATDQPTPAKAGKAMPDFVGKAVTAATGSLPGGTAIRTTDARGSRAIIIGSNWKICTQNPAPGAAFKGRTVRFTAVKFGERCP